MPDIRPETRALIASTKAVIAEFSDEEVTVIPDDGNYDHRLVQMSILNAQVCTRKTPTQAAEWLSMVRPPGTTANRWEFDPDHGEVTCEQFPDTHRHVIVNC